MKHTVRAGECLPTIAAKYGFAWESLWNHPSNAGLRGRRGSPTVLAPGDEVEIPDRQPRTESASSGRVASFVVPATQLRLRLVDCGQPIADTAVAIDAGGSTVKGATDAEGMLKFALPRGAKQARLTIDGRADEIVLLLGHLDPGSETSGQQARLRNLAFYGGEVDGRANEGLTNALREFQLEHGLQATGEADAPTQQKLVEVHGC